MPAAEFATLFPHDLSAVQNKVDEINDHDNAVHTVKIVLNGQHGGWDVFIEYNDWDMENFGLKYIMDPNGNMRTSGESYTP